LKASFGYLKHKSKTLEFTQQHFWTPSSFWVKIHFDPMIGWKGLNKINVYKIYNIQFLNGHGASCLWFMKHYQQNKIEKIMYCPSINSPPLWYGNGFFQFFKNYAFIIKQMQKKHIFWMKFHPKILHLKIFLDLIDVYQYHTL